MTGKLPSIPGDSPDRLPLPLHPLDRGKYVSRSRGNHISRVVVRPEDLRDGDVPEELLVAFAARLGRAEGICRDGL